MARELAALWVVVSSAVDSELGCSPNGTLCVDIMGELVTEFQKLEEQTSRLERLVVRINDLLLGPPPGQARLADHLDEAARQFWVELAAQ
jgi:hypothetical protein